MGDDGTMSGDILPNFFIVGAPKSGTTSMHDWLSTHPDVFMSPFKEPRHFCHDLTFAWRYDDLGDYLGLFGAATDESIRGESSVWYLYSEVAARQIHEVCGDVKILAMLRNPVDMVHALHSQFVWNGDEPITSFEQAYRAEEDRRAGKRLPEEPNPLEGLYYKEVGRYAPQLERYFDVFGRDNVRVLLFDEFVQDPPGAFRETCRFLEVDEDHDPSFENRNPNTVVRSSWFRDFTQDLPPVLQTVTSRLPMGLRLKLRRLALKVNTRVQDREPLDPELRRELEETYGPDIRRLETLLDEGLSDWLGTS